jgi:hypothetical protein
MSNATASDRSLSSSFSVGLGRAQIFAAGDLLSLTVTQPQRVERANAALALETSIRRTERS